MLRPSLRIAFAVVVASAALPAFALESHAPAASEAVPAESTPGEAAAEAVAPPARPGSNPARSKYVHTAPAGNAASGGGDGEDAGVVHGNPRNSKWHSYLPGMFR